MADEIIRLDYSAEDIGDNIDEVREARGEYDSLDERLDEIEGGGFTPTQAQLAAINSGITDDNVEQIDLNKNNILLSADQTTQYNIVPIKSTITTGNASVTATVAEDKTITITITGTTSSAIGFEISDNFVIDTTAQYVMTGNPSAGAIRLILQQAESPYNWIQQQYNNQAATATPSVSLVRYYVYIYANSSGTITLKPMLIPKSIYNAGFTNYQPYALPNTALTPALQECVDNGKKNKVHVDNSGTFTASGSARSYDIPINVTGDIAISFGSLTSTDTDSDSCAIVFLNSSNVGFLTISMNRGNNVSEIVKLTDIATKVRLYPASSYNESSGDTVTWNNLMICDESLWKVSQNYQPPAMSNAELTEEVIPLAKGIKLVAHTSNNGNTSLSYDTNINDFYIGANTDKNSGVYLIVCNNWSTTPAPYIGLLTFSGATTNHFVKTDIVTGFAPTISITENTANATIDISGAAKISIYAIR
ncbi:MAG: hypothetical protein IKN66_09585 [Ruminococcus sp.]|nr:hypothetical protein [Ruminococcus sp.]